MDEKRFRQVAAYHATMALIRRLVSENVISGTEYSQLEMHFKEKYDLRGTVIYQ